MIKVMVEKPPRERGRRRATSAYVAASEGGVSIRAPAWDMIGNTCVWPSKGGEFQSVRPSIAYAILPVVLIRAPAWGATR